MRFKTIFWLFNVVVAAALAIFIVSSLFIFGKDYAAVYWSNMWIVVLLFVILISVLDFYFIRNWTLFGLLEKEDWPALLAWLEEKIYTRGVLNRAYAGLLINTALSVNNLEAVSRLETEIREKKPGLLRNVGVALGIPKLKTGDSKVLLEHFTALADDKRTNGRDWARWCRAKASGSDGEEELEILLDSRDCGVRLLAYDRLEKLSPEKAAAARARILTDLTGSSGEKALQRSREDHLMGAVMSSAAAETRLRILAVG